MKDPRIITGFSRLSKDEKVDLVAGQVKHPLQFAETLRSSWHRDPLVQKLYDEFSENTLSNYYFPYGVAPNFLINGKLYIVPLVIEESSVVAAASGAAKFWAERGGFHSEVISMKKIGQVHFLWKGDIQPLKDDFPIIKQRLLERTHPITENMKLRGGGISDIELVDMTDSIPDYYQIKGWFDTRDSMGANFINSCLEEFADQLKEYVTEDERLDENNLEIIMSILSNYTPECRVNTWVECDLSTRQGFDDSYSDEDFVRRFQTGIAIAQVDVNRATTHNKGIFNGIDAVALATGNDFRAMEACGHTWASRDGKYKSLSEISVKDGKFRFSLDIPLAIGTVGGLTNLHPLAKYSLELLGNPGADELMMIASAAGLANNYAAVKSLVTKGIQKGHMKMHLLNILNVFQATEAEKKQAIEFFKHEKVAYSTVSKFIESIR
ncbi:MAG: hydroxymethylglutaryl-CoA reductase [Bacteroidetes bacterium]|nr:hydroxymethylglutaryl-CoA reductase [Bacteroidota bacterium]